MSEYRDPHDPLYRDPLYGDMHRASQFRSEAYGSGMLWAWLIGVILVIGVLIFAFGTGDGTQTAQFDAPPASTPSAPAIPAE